MIRRLVNRWFPLPTIQPEPWETQWLDRATNLVAGLAAEMRESEERDAHRLAVAVAIEQSADIPPAERRRR